MIDIDHFKSINDRFGHDAGDEVIRSVAEVIKKTVRSDGLLARWGGEEFLVAIPVHTASEAEATTARILAAIRELHTPDSKEFRHRFLSASAGISFSSMIPFSEFYLERINGLIALADQALYEAKKPRGEYRVAQVKRSGLRHYVPLNLALRERIMQRVLEWKNFIAQLLKSSGSVRHYWIGIGVLTLLPIVSSIPVWVVLTPISVLYRKVVQSRTSEMIANAYYDPLTGLRGRQALGLDKEDGYLPTLFRSATRTENPIPASLLFLDLDHFKKINDTYGHGAGDETLRKVADLREMLQPIRGEILRYSGEEFVIILPGFAEAEASVLAEQIRQHLANLSIRYTSVNPDNVFSFGVTASIGVREAVRHPDLSLLQDVQRWVNLADKAMYDSKQTGRNKVTVSRRPLTGLAA